MGEWGVKITNVKNYNILTIIVMFAILSSFTLAEDNITNGLVAYWTMNETAGDGIRDAIGGCNGTGTATANASGRIGYGRNFNGAQSITTSTCTFKVVTGCVSAWIYITTHVVNGAIVKVTTFPKGWMMNINAGTQVEFATYDGSANPKVTDPVVQSNSTWVHYVGCYRNNTVTSMRLWRNGNPIVNSTPAIGTMVEAQEGLTFGLNSGFYFKGVIDEVGFWNRFLNDTEIVTMYDNYLNGSTPLNSSSGGGGAGIVINTVNFTNKTRGVISNSNVFASTKYFLRVNATTGATCNFSQVNITDYFVNGYPTASSGELNITSAVNQSFSFIDLTEITQSEQFEIRVCYYGGTAKDLDIYWNNNATIYKTIPKEIIPACGSFNTVINISKSNFKNQTDFIFACPTCTGSNKLSLQTFDNNLNNLKFERLHANSTHTTTYNTTTNFYEYYTHYHSFFTAGTYDTVVNCNGTFSTLQTTVGMDTPQAYTTFATSDGTTYNLSGYPLIERGINYSFVGDCRGAVGFSNITTEIYNITGSKVASNNSALLLTNITALNHVGNYTFNITCTSTDGNTTRAGIKFYLNDTLPPQLIVSYFLDTALEFYVNETVPLEFYFSDNNLYGVNITCFLGSTKVYEHLALNLFVQEYEVNYNLSNLTTTGNFYCNVEVCDDHTETLYNIEDKGLKIDYWNRALMIDGKTIINTTSAYDVEKLTLIKKDDRLSYCYDFETYNEKGLKRFIYEFPKDDWVLRNAINGHFASWGRKEWIDFVPRKDTPFIIDSISLEDDNYIIETSSDSQSGLQCMDSIGGLNCQDYVLSYMVVSVPIPETVTDMSVQELSTGKSILLLALVLLYGILLIFGIMTAEIVIVALACVFGIMLAIVIYPYSFLISAIFLFINAGLIVMQVVGQKY